MSKLDCCKLAPRIELTLNFVYDNEYVKKVTVKEGQLIKNLVYLKNGVKTTVSGILDVIHFNSKSGFSNSNGCVHDDESVFDKYVNVTSLIIDCSSDYKCKVVSIPARMIQDIESVEDVEKKSAVVDGVEYSSFAEALSSVSSGSTISLTEDVQSDEKITVPEGDITINLNEHKLHIPTVENNYGMVVKGNATIEGNGKVVTGFYGIGVQPKASLTINDGIFKLYEGDYLIGSWGETTINGGEFYGKYCCVNGFDGIVNITGGKFIADESTIILGNVKVSGGIFNHPVAEEYCAEGYAPKTLGKDEYTVEKIPEVVE